MNTIDDMPPIDFSKCKIIGRGLYKDRKLTLSVLRQSRGLTQEEVAAKAKISQSEVSRAELRDDCLVSTLARYAEALGGELLLYVKIDGRKYPTALAERRRLEARR